MRASSLAVALAPLALAPLALATGCNAAGSAAAKAGGLSTAATTSQNTLVVVQPSPSPAASPAPSPSPSPSPAATTAVSNWLHCANGQSNTITTLALDPVTGAPSNPVSVSLYGSMIPGAAVFHVNAIAADPTGTLLFAAGYTTRAVYPPTTDAALLPIQVAKGVLTPGTYLPTGAKGASNGVVVSPVTSTVFTLDAYSSPVTTPGGTTSNGGLTAFTYDATGTLTPGTSVTLGTTGAPTGAAIDATGTFLYAADAADQILFPLGIDAAGFVAGTNPAPSPVQTSGPVSVCLASSANTLVTGNVNGTFSVWGFLGAGAVQLSYPNTPVVPAVAVGQPVLSVALDPTGSFLVTADGSTADVSLFWINNLPIAPQTTQWQYPFQNAGAIPTSVVWNANGAVVYVTDQGANTITALQAGPTGLTAIGSPVALPASDVQPVSLAITQ